MDCLTLFAKPRKDGRSEVVIAMRLVAEAIHRNTNIFKNTESQVDSSDSAELQKILINGLPRFCYRRISQ